VFDALDQSAPLLARDLEMPPKVQQRALAYLFAFPADLPAITCNNALKQFEKRLISVNNVGM
jgi:hypothetical protein